MARKYTAKELNRMKTISESQTDDLKVLKKDSKGTTKIWLSRMTKEDGMPYDNQITEERYEKRSDGWNWKTVREYRG